MIRKPLYRIFSKSPLGYITVLMLFLTLLLGVQTLLKIKENGLGIVTGLLHVPLLFFLLLVFSSIWLLTSSILPIIRIDEYGIKAYSLFWKRKLAWTDIKAARLLRCQSQLGAGRRLQLKFDYTAMPQKQSLLSNKGIKITTFIVVSRQAIKPKANLTLSIKLLSHSLISTSHEILFEYELFAWQTIQEIMNNAHNSNIKKLDD
jgi:hypothetical protein